MLSTVSKHGRAFLLALQFLTIVPCPRQVDTDPALQGLSLLWYPVIGLLLGMFLTVICSVLPMPFYMQAALTIALWIFLTGGLHLDGLADCADAWTGGLGDREKTLRLLQDPLCGSMGVIALILVILLKTMGLAAVIEAGQLHWLWIVPLLARLSLLLLFLTTTYVRPQGLGEVLAQYFPRSRALCVLVGVAALLLYMLPLDLWCAAVMLPAAICLSIRRAAARRLGGFTGDVAGAQVELVEAGLLFALASLI